MTPQRLFIGWSVAMLLLAVGTAGAQTGGPVLTSPTVPLGTGFTYQGRLNNAGSPVTNTCAFQFGLWASAAGGAQLGITQTVNNVSVSDGAFTVNLNGGGEFGVGAFDGNARYLGVEVLCAGDGGFTALAPRQPLTPAPYALYSGDADLLDGQDSTAFAATAHIHSGADILTGTVGEAFIASAIARDSEITPTVLANDGAGSGLDADLLDGVDLSALRQKAANVVVVAKSGGDFTSIQAALDSLTDNNTDNRYLVWVAPGIYTETVIMKPYVDIEGAGELMTKITYIGSSGTFTGTVIGADNAELRFLTVENTGGDTYAIAIYNDSASPRLTQVTASASGSGNNIGVRNDSSSPTMAHMTASALGGSSNNYGVINVGSSPTMTRVTASASGGSSNNLGVLNESSSPTLMDVTVSASGGASNYGVYNVGSSPTIYNSVLNASGGSSYGLYNFAFPGSFTVRLDNSSITGATNTIVNVSAYTVHVGASQLSGGPVSGTGLTCAGVYDENYVFSASTCP